MSHEKRQPPEKPPRKRKVPEKEKLKLNIPPIGESKTKRSCVKKDDTKTDKRSILPSYEGNEGDTEEKMGLESTVLVPDSPTPSSPPLFSDDDFSGDVCVPDTPDNPPGGNNEETNPDTLEEPEGTTSQQYHGSATYSGGTIMKETDNPPEVKTTHPQHEQTHMSSSHFGEEQASTPLSSSFPGERQASVDSGIRRSKSWTKDVS